MEPPIFVEYIAAAKCLYRVWQRRPVFRAFVITLALTTGCGGTTSEDPPPVEEEVPIDCDVSYDTRCGETASEEDPSGEEEVPIETSCALTGEPLQFIIGPTGSTQFWVDRDANTIELPEDLAVPKLLFDVPPDSLPSGVDSLTIEIDNEPNENLPENGHVDTAIRITALNPADFSGFASGNQAPPSVTLRYDPDTCGITPEEETNLVLGRLSTSGLWQEVCGTTPRFEAQEVSCSEGDLSFGVFGVISRDVVVSDDTIPPVFNTRSGLSLTATAWCLDPSCNPPLVALQWGPASDSGGSGLAGYRIYVDGLRTNQFAAPSGNPVNFTFLPPQPWDDYINGVPQLYQIKAIDGAGNESALFGGLRLP